MKLIFRFMPIVTGNWLLDSPTEVPKTQNCIPFPCFSCKHYIRESLLSWQSFIIDVNTSITDDGCLRQEAFTSIEYDTIGKAFCEKYSRDLSISRQL